MPSVLPFRRPSGRGTTPAIPSWKPSFTRSDLGPPSWKQNAEECETLKERMGNTMKAFRKGVSLSAAALAHRTRAGVRVVRHVCSRSLEALHAPVARTNVRSEAWQVNPHTEADQERFHSKFSRNATVAKGHGGPSSMSLFTEFLSLPPDTYRVLPRRAMTPRPAIADKKSGTPAGRWKIFLNISLSAHSV